MRPITSRGPTESMSAPANSATALVSETEEMLNIRSRKRPAVLEDIGVPTESARLKAMLGHVDTSQDNIFNREDFCGACGIQHPNYPLLDCYPLCESCLNCLREQSVLRQRFEGTVQDTPLEICFATYGDLNNCRMAYEVTEEVQLLVNEYQCKDRLILRETNKLHEMFKGDPNPGRPKQLRIRYRLNGVHGMLLLDVMDNNQIPEPVMLIAMAAPRELTILRGSYGHPKGRTNTGRMAYDVKENLQGLVDLQKGSYLYISALSPIIRQFGDPCVGYVKDLQIEFDIGGKFGNVEVGELRGHLKKELCLRTSPCLSPLIYIASATYGLTETGIKERTQQLNRWLNTITTLKDKRKIGLPIRVKDRQLMKKEDIFLEELMQLQQATPAFIDITNKVQRIVEMQGGLEFVLNRRDFDPNFTFGNPRKGRKQLEVSVKCDGHDSEIRTDSKEVTVKGFMRNFILGKKNRYLITVVDDETGRGVMEESIEFRTNNVLPLMNIERASYGHPRDDRKSFDVTTTIQNMVKGRYLVIKRDLDLNKIFGDPCFGVNKVLRIGYSTRGFTGAVRVREKGGVLSAAVEIGFPPEIPTDDA